MVTKDELLLLYEELLETKSHLRVAKDYLESAERVVDRSRAAIASVLDGQKPTSTTPPKRQGDMY